MKVLPSSDQPTAHFLPPPASPFVRRVAAVATHGIPGVAIGAVAVGVFLANHILHQIWEALPFFLALGLSFFALLWFVYSLERKDINGDARVTRAFWAGALFCFGVGTLITVWVLNHPGPVAQQPELSCAGHFGPLGTAPQITHLPVHDGHRMITYVSCGDGYSFQVPEN